MEVPNGYLFFAKQSHIALSKCEVAVNIRGVNTLDLFNDWKEIKWSFDADLWIEIVILWLVQCHTHELITLWW